MELKINVVEAAAEIAEKEVLRAMLGQEVYVTEEDGSTTFTEDAQDLFNIEYDEIFSKLIEAKVGQLPTTGHKVIDVLGLVEKMSHQATEKYFMTTYSTSSNEEILDTMWELGVLNEMKYTEYGQRVFNQAEEKYLMNLMEFEV